MCVLISSLLCGTSLGSSDVNPRLFWQRMARIRIKNSSHFCKPPFVVGKRNSLNMHFVLHVGRSLNEIPRFLFVWQKHPLYYCSLYLEFPSRVPIFQLQELCPWCVLLAEGVLSVLCVAQGGFRCPSLRRFY